MKHAFRTPFDARLPSGWPLRVGLILLAALLASPVSDSRRGAARCAGFGR